LASFFVCFSSLVKAQLPPYKSNSRDGKEFVPIAIPNVDEYQTKKEIKAEKATTKAYGKYVKKLEKKNAKFDIHQH